MAASAHRSAASNAPWIRRGRRASKTVALRGGRGGTHFLTETFALAPAHCGLSMVTYRGARDHLRHTRHACGHTLTPPSVVLPAGESPVVVSSGVLLKNLKWKPYPASRAGGGAGGGAKAEHGNVWVTNVGEKTAELPGLHIDGMCTTRAIPEPRRRRRGIAVCVCVYVYIYIHMYMYMNI